MAIRQSVGSGNTHSAPWAFGSAVVDGDQLQITDPAHAITIDANCALGISLCSTHQSRPITLVTGSGGSLPTGPYRIRLAPVGATGIATPSTAAASTSITSLGQLIRITIPTLPAAASSWNVYLSEGGGAAFTERRYATGVAPGTFDCTSALWESGTTPYASAAGLPFGDAIGYSPALTAHTGGIIVSDGVTVTLKGDLTILGDLTLNAGSVVEFDAAASPSGLAVYRHYFGTVNAVGTGKLIMRGGSAASRAIVRSKAGTTSAHLRTATQTFTTSDMRLDLQWARFSKLGSTADAAIACKCAAAYNQLLTDVIFDADCSTLSFSSQPGTGGWALTRVALRQTTGITVGGQVVCLSTNPAEKTTGLRTMFNVAFEVLPPSLARGGSLYDSCYFHDRWFLSADGGGILTGGNLNNSFVRFQNIGCSLDFDSADGYLYRDIVTEGGVDFNPNSFGMPPRKDGGTRVHTRWTAEFNGTDITGDFNGVGGVTGTVRIEYFVDVPNAVNKNSQTLCTINSQSSPSFFVELDHNTYMAENGGVVTSEGSPTPAGFIASLRSNLVFSIGATENNRYALSKATQDGQNDTMDVASPSNVGYNAGWNLLSVEGQWVGAYSWYNTRFSSAPANDVDLGDSPGADVSLFGPKFVDPTRKFITWCEIVLGAGGTNAQKITAGLNALKAIADTSSPNHVPGLLMTDPATWVRAGFVPQNEALRNAAHDADEPGRLHPDIGAMAMEAAAPGGGGEGGARLIGIGGGRVAA